MSQAGPAKSFSTRTESDDSALPKIEITVADAGKVIMEEQNNMKVQSFELEWHTDWSMEQWEDPFCLNICRYLVFGQLPTEAMVADQVIKDAKFFLVGEDKQLYRRPNPQEEEMQLVVPGDGSFHALLAI
uniref:Uncharacterized protein n=1 Tax=Romanomermis culicivorax TaxID=13658 RepID=A0A915IR18_ROMCU